MRSEDDEKALREERERMSAGVDLGALVADNARRKAELLARPETAAEARAQEEYLASVASRADASPRYVSDYHRNLAVAARDRDEYGKSLRFLSSLDLGALAATAADIGNHVRAVLGLKVNLAAAYFTLGEFETARITYPYHDQTRIRYEEYAAADLRPDDLECDCPKMVDAVERGVAIRVPSQFSEGEFPNARRSAKVYAVRCKLCGDVNLRPDLTEAARLSREAVTTDRASWESLAAPDAEMSADDITKSLDERYEAYYREHPDQRPGGAK